MLINHIILQSMFFPRQQMGGDLPLLILFYGFFCPAEEEEEIKQPSWHLVATTKGISRLPLKMKGQQVGIKSKIGQQI